MKLPIKQALELLPAIQEQGFRSVPRACGRVEWEGDLDEHSRRELG